ncbi:hypothetical protein DLAC_09916 [Tieghemostelium lacteum]|uniref:N-acetyltransferase domain-containing protein n=1 Tax=Tieghemostelium lacteum TaxID=361077 RepID=A0A151Z5P0_TIELA|nr:hypothetical protein DLAC_09916 [Tieghemostelium lacteum]|eukprot:KYQ89258.1 hypothetical protein DLAC_09916 [Tieghemostelium lacteum]
MNNRYKIVDLDSQENKIKIETILKNSVDHERQQLNCDRFSISLGIYDEDNENRYIGGVYADVFGQTCHVSLLGINKEYRKQSFGMRLMKQVEEIAKTKYSCISMTVTTYDFQAPLFYMKLGFKKFAELKDVPIAGVTKIYFMKYLDHSSSPSPSLSTSTSSLQ